MKKRCTGKTFLKELKDRGLNQVKFTISSDYAGLEGAGRAVFRCEIHLLANSICNKLREFIINKRAFPRSLLRNCQTKSAPTGEIPKYLVACCEDREFKDFALFCLNR